MRGEVDHGPASSILELCRQAICKRRRASFTTNEQAREDAQLEEASDTRIVRGLGKCDLIAMEAAIQATPISQSSLTGGKFSEEEGLPSDTRSFCSALWLAQG
jgi:hypothetical protein